MPATAQISSLSEVSPLTPTAPSSTPSFWISTPPGAGVGASPILKEQMMQQIRCDQVKHIAKCLHLGPKVIGELYR
jgi:hypothetical protein